MSHECTLTRPSCAFGAVVAEGKETETETETEKEEKGQGAGEAGRRHEFMALLLLFFACCGALTPPTPAPSHQVCQVQRTRHAGWGAGAVRCGGAVLRAGVARDPREAASEINLQVLPCLPFPCIDRPRHCTYRYVWSVYIALAGED